MKKLLSAVMASALVFTLSTAAQAGLAGDVNKDGTVNAMDALDVLMYSTGKEKLINSLRSDVNGDGAINSSDALEILKISVGSYKGSLEVNDELTTAYKSKYVDPVLKSGTFTMKMNVTADGQEMPMVMAFDKDRMYASFSMDGIDAALLYMNGKSYILMPTLLVGMPVYMEVEGEDDALSELTGAFTSIADVESDYIGSSKYKYGTKNYICEEYTDEDGNIYRYYFEGTKWRRFEVISDFESMIYDISEFSDTVDEKLFSLKGYIKIESDMPF